MKTIKVQLFVEYCRGSISPGGWCFEGNCILEFLYDGTLEDYPNGYRKAQEELINQIDSSQPHQYSIFFNFSVIKAVEEEVL
jgi:hypothetical protein